MKNNLDFEDTADAYPRSHLKKKQLLLITPICLKKFLQFFWFQKIDFYVSFLYVTNCFSMFYIFLYPLQTYTVVC